ncbi:nuclear transport factor 2 family protein [Ruegeria sediminis]|uniref:Nuclear transport factor 2 family protein n=1 Tax=Ruegeria sediminis TaxID=2583820 RepID=A0ABY2WZP0_9RHOB|nr:nuclear transport factor 2 family protein [Ruegeria sediminis]TMV07968.1 nuclear transport factor 2 family protein [Ruegeria sediminis]
MPGNRSDRVRAYFQALTAGDIPAILKLFTPDAEIHSPFLGVMKAQDFYAKLDAASASSELTVLDVLLGEDGQSAAAHFRYDWVLKSGNRLVFEGVDHFTFGADDRFTAMRIYYDTHPVREEVGDKYA